MADDDQDDALQVAADAVLMMRSSVEVGVREPWFAALDGYLLHFTRVSQAAGNTAAAAAIASGSSGPDLDVISEHLVPMVSEVVRGVGVYTAGAVLLAAHLLAEVVTLSGREAGEVIRDILERDGNG